MWSYLDLNPHLPAIIDTDLHRGIGASGSAHRYSAMSTRPICAEHRMTPSTAPRTMLNPLFPVNYVDRLIRHRLRQHTREVINRINGEFSQCRADVYGSVVPESLEAA